MGYLWAGMAPPGLQTDLPHPCRPPSFAGIRLTWHPQGDFLAVQVDKWTKTKKSTHTNFELFSLRWVVVTLGLITLLRVGVVLGGTDEVAKWVR